MFIKVLLLTTALTTSIYAASSESDNVGTPQHPTRWVSTSADSETHAFPAKGGAGAPVPAPVKEQVSLDKDLFKGKTIEFTSEESVESYIRESLLYKDNPAKYLSLLRLKEEYKFLEFLTKREGVTSARKVYDLPGSSFEQYTIDLLKKMRDLHMSK